MNWQLANLSFEPLKKIGTSQQDSISETTISNKSITINNSRDEKPLQL